MDKCKGKELMACTSKRPKKKAGEMSSAFLPSSGANAELYKPEFSTYDLGKKVTVADSTKDHDISMALARAIMLPNNVATIF